MPRKPLHPLAQEALMMGLRMGARAAARAIDSMMKDAAAGLGSAEERVQKARGKLRRKVKDSIRSTRPVRIEVDEEAEDDGFDEEE